VPKARALCFATPREYVNAILNMALVRESDDAADEEGRIDPRLWRRIARAARRSGFETPSEYVHAILNAALVGAVDRNDSAVGREANCVDLDDEIPF
jgi:hypothetical protein